MFFSKAILMRIEQVVIIKIFNQAVIHNPLQYFGEAGENRYGPIIRKNSGVICFIEGNNFSHFKLIREYTCHKRTVENMKEWFADMWETFFQYM